MLWSLSPSTANGLPWSRMAALTLFTADCYSDTSLGLRSWCSVSWLTNSILNCLLYFAYMRDISVVAIKNLCLTLTLLEIQTSPDLTFNWRFKFSQAWSTPTEVRGVPFLLTERLPPTSSFHVSGYVVLRSRISDIYRGQSLLYLMRYMEKNSLLSCSPVARWSAMSALRDEQRSKERPQRDACSSVFFKLYPIWWPSWISKLPQ